MASNTSARLAGPTPRHPRRGPDALLSDRGRSDRNLSDRGTAARTAVASPASVAQALDTERHARRAGGGTPVNPALARMHERLRARRPLDARDVPGVSETTEAARKARVAAAVAAAPAAKAPAAQARTAEAPAQEQARPQRFMRLQGLSGRTYVFSRIEPRHVSLYRNGVFAWVARDSKGGGERASVIGEVLPITSNAIDEGALYVHLLAQDSGDRADVLADLK